MADEKNDDRLETGSALTTAIIGVFLALSSILGGNANDDIMIHRGLANNQWAYFQAKSTKQALFEVNRKMFETQLDDPTLAPLYREAVQKKLDDFDARVARYESEKNEIREQAEKHEKLSEAAAEIENMYDYAEAFYQIAIIISAIAIIAKRRELWYLGTALGTIAVSLTGYAYFFL